MRSPELSSAQRHKAEWWLLGTERREMEVSVDEYKVAMWEINKVPQM